MKPELNAALAATMLVHLVLAATMYAAHHIYRNRIPGTRYWFGAALATALGHGYFVVAPALPALAGYLIPNLLMATGVVSATFGSRSLSGRRVSIYYFLAAEAVVSVLFTASGIINPSFHIRSLIMGALSCAGAAIASFYLFFPAKREDRPVTAVGAAVFALFSAASVFRLARLLLSAPISGGAETPEWYILFVNLSLAMYVALGVAFYLMVGGLLTRSLERSLNENTLLLREIGHRTKNNLALVGSLVSLQASSMTDEAAKNAFRDLGERLRTITTVYRMLSRVEDGHKADARQYLEALSAGIRDSIIASRRDIELSVRSDPRVLDTKQLVSLGLIVNELATNSIKYAFPDGKAGKIELRFSSEGDQCSLSFKDNGVGFDDDSRNAEGLGLSLVRSLASQLKGSLLVESQPGQGSVFTLHFPA